MRAEDNQQRWKQAAANQLHRLPLVVAIACLLLGVAVSPLLRSCLQWLPDRLRVSTAGWLTIIVTVGAMIALAVGRRRWASTLGWCCFFAIGVVSQWHHESATGDDLSTTATRDYRPLVCRVEILGSAVWRPNAYFRAGDDENKRWLTQWRVACYQVRDGDQWVKTQAISTLTVTGRIDDMLPGDRLQVFGSYALVPPPTNPGEGDLRPLFHADGQFVFLRADSKEQVQLLVRSWRRPLSRLTAIAVRRIDRAIHRYVTLEQAPLAAALVFGQRQQVDWNEQQHLLSTGTLHMLAISGMHIEMVAGALFVICWLMGLHQRQSLIVVAVCILAYAMIAGANPPVLRAVFIVLAVCLARWKGRRIHLSNLLAFSALALLLMNSWWIHNVGVQLSFVAVAAIALFAQGVTGRGARADALAAVIEESRSPRERYVRQVLLWCWQMTCLSFWIWLFTLPLIWANFHIVSFVAIPLNILLWPFLVVGLLSGLLLFIVWWLPPIAWLLGWICGICLWCITQLVWLGDLVPLGHLWLPSPGSIWLGSYVAISVAGCVLIYWKSHFRPYLGATLVFWLLIGLLPFVVGQRGLGPDWLRNLAMAAAPSWFKYSSDQLRVTFIDVGHGTSVLMELPTGEVWLYDAGHLGGGPRSHEKIAAVLWSLPTSRIDRMFLSHADADHYNAVPGLIERFRVNSVTASPHFWQHTAPELGLLREQLNHRGVQMLRLVENEQLQAGQILASVLHPPGDWSDKADNGNSLTLRVEYAGRSCLLPGDLEKAGLSRLLSRTPSHCDVLMAPHHGSLTQDPRRIIQWSTPDWVVISGGPRAANPKVIARYSPGKTQALLTHQQGAIQLRIARDGRLSMWHWTENRWVEER